MFAAYFISSRLSVTVGGVTASVSGVEVKDGNLRMVNPTLKGVDKKNGAYVISADYADQDMKNPKLIRLHAIKAELTTDQKGWSRVQAVRGLFNSEAERLIMQDDIRVSTSSGVTGKLTNASLETKSQTLRSHQPVAFDLPNGTVRANALTLHSADNTLTVPRQGAACTSTEVDKQRKTAARGRRRRPPQDQGTRGSGARAAGGGGARLPAEIRTQHASSRTSMTDVSARGLSLAGHRRDRRSCTPCLRRAPAEAQTVSNTLRRLLQEFRPADRHRVRTCSWCTTRKKYATFKGNVKAVQGTTTLRANELDVHYVGGGGDSLTGSGDDRQPTPCQPTPRAKAPAASASAAEAAPRSARSRRAAMSSSPATRTRPRRAIGPFTMCRRRS